MNADKMNTIGLIDDVQRAIHLIYAYALKTKNNSAMDAVKEIDFQILELTDAIENFGGE